MSPASSGLDRQVARALLARGWVPEETLHAAYEAAAAARARGEAEGASLAAQLLELRSAGAINRSSWASLNDLDGSKRSSIELR